MTAVAVLYCDRTQQGLLPFFPGSLASLTGYSNAHTSELAAAITGLNRCVRYVLFADQFLWFVTAAGAACNGFVL